MFQIRDTWQDEPGAITVPKHYIPYKNGWWELSMMQESGAMYWDHQQGQRVVLDQHPLYPSAPHKHMSLVLAVEKKLSLTKVSVWLCGLVVLGASAWSLRYSTSTEFLSWITIFGAATLFGGCLGILYLQLHFVKNRYTDRFRLAQMRARIFFQRLH
ncbi:hypothetical protein CC77DRAFT_1018240 [Alternaria alternata]|jgi:hypothetical protein|uniref:Uncharacterized protein n=1 Tax=Alternaria alternata TaxID=5599 RepID=A0A177DXA4_ALTAL|nr:hypothetical protein CC77DRAFT_1018240 [Alternaria alternata]OAG23419.1 hypothetical protein CC77DRAFT_1018240 [Alternaria alternata]